MSTVGRNPVKYAGIHRKRLPGITRTRTSYMMYNRKNIYATAIVCCLASGAMCAYGQEESVPEENTARQASETVLTLKDCMEYALANSADIRIQEADNDDLRTARRDAILAAFAPNISANASAHTNFGRAVDPETNTYITSVSFSNAWSVSAGITLFNGFYAVNNLKITRIAQAMGLSMEQQIRDRICLATIEAYYNAVYYSSLADIVSSCVKTAEDVLHLTVRQEELGQKSHSDVVQAKAELADREYRLTETRNRLKDAYITLKDIMFWPTDEPLEIDCETELQDRIIPYPDTDISETVGFLPAAAIAKGKMENARIELRTARWQLAPSLSLSGGWSTNYYTYPGDKGYVPTPYWTQLGDNSGEYLQLSLSIPIFNRLSRQSAIARKKNACKRASAEYDRTIREIEAEVLRAESDVAGAEAALASARRRSGVQKEAYRLSRRKFEQGLISAIEYRTETENLLNATMEELNARIQLKLKRRILAYYKGIPYMMQD